MDMWDGEAEKHHRKVTALYCPAILLGHAIQRVLRVKLIGVNISSPQRPLDNGNPRKATICIGIAEEGRLRRRRYNGTNDSKRIRFANKVNSTRGMK
eukprot:scaffold22014_cov77-Skeletonema_marinoi.AAC.2